MCECEQVGGIGVCILCIIRVIYNLAPSHVSVVCFATKYIIGRIAFAAMRTKMVPLITCMVIIVSSFDVTWGYVKSMQWRPNYRWPGAIAGTVSLHRKFAMATCDKEENASERKCTWSPQDLTQDNPNFFSIPDHDYVKKYQRNPELWPVEFFLIVYRHSVNPKTAKKETQVLVRKSSNGTAKWGVGTGVPVTRWMVAKEQPPFGYQLSEPCIFFDASNFPEFAQRKDKISNSWTYHKINIREDAFDGSDQDTSHLQDSELQEYAKKIRDSLKMELSKRLSNERRLESSWKRSRILLVRRILDNSNCVAAIQGTLRMSGLFAQKEGMTNDNCHDKPSASSRYEDLLDHVKLAESTRIYTMFPQMPHPLPLPSTSPDELRKEIDSRPIRMLENGRDPHQDKFGRKFTHISTSNVSNTIHGVYFTMDVTDVPGLNEVPAFDLFGTERVKRQWVSLTHLKVLDSIGLNISVEDPKPTFISGFVVRQLITDGIIKTCE